MNLGWVGLGALGSVCALTLAEEAGHSVTGYDIHPDRIDQMLVDIPLGDDAYGEQGLGSLLAQLDRQDFHVADSVGEVVKRSDVVFVSVQTPHAPEYGGEVPAPSERRDFDYEHLVNACAEVCSAALTQRKHATMVVVSTVLPGTCERLIRPLLNDYVTLVYSPAFVAMGTVIADYRAPEFVLAGVDKPEDAWPLADVFAALHGQPVRTMSVESAELCKVAYNTFISVKICWANTLMEICHKTGADCDDIVDALSVATDRVISPRYLRGGMADGGGCHPRDLIAMSWLAERLDLSYDLLGDMASAREQQTWWLADVVLGWCRRSGLDAFILGKAYKPGTALTAGSPALLLAHGLDNPPAWDPHVDSAPFVPDGPQVFVVATRHPEFADLALPEGSVVIDPHGYVPDQPGVTVVAVGRKR